MTISWLQAALLGLFACLSSMPGLGGTSFGNYTLGRPLIGGLVCGIILGDIKTGILVGAAMQVVYIALVTPGGTVSADVRAVSYIGIPLAMVALNSYGLSAATKEGAALATSFGTMVGTLGIRSCICKRYLISNIFWSNGRNNRYSIILWNSNNQLSMATCWMESC